MKRFKTIAVASLVFALTAISGGVAGALPVITNGLVGAYEFNGNANDSSFVANHGTEHGTVGYSAGLVGQGVEFTGNGYVLLPANTNLSFYANDFSVNIWINQPNPLGGILLDERAGPERGYGMGTDSSHASWGGGDGLGGSYATGVYDEAENDVVATDDGEWHQFTAVRTGTAVQLYLDGVLRSESLGAPINIGVSNPIYVGRRFVAGSSVDFARGTFDELSIYNRALSAAEVQTLYSVIPEPNTALLLGIGLSALAVRRENR